MGLFFGQRFSSKFKQTDFEKQACKIKKAIFKSKKPQSIRYLPHSHHSNFKVFFFFSKPQKFQHIQINNAHPLLKKKEERVYEYNVNSSFSFSLYLFTFLPPEGNKKR
jgi:hypothetical protein